MPLSRTAKYYRDNPEARKKHRKSSAKAQKKKSAVKNRVESNKARRKAKAAGKNISGKDASHTKSGRIVFENSSKNRARNGMKKGRSPKANRKSTRK